MYNIKNIFARQASCNQVQLYFLDDMVAFGANFSGSIIEAVLANIENYKCRACMLRPASGTWLAMSAN